MVHARKRRVRRSTRRQSALLSAAARAHLPNGLAKRARTEAIQDRTETSPGFDQHARIYTQWGNLTKALEWLETVMRLRNPGLVKLKIDPLMDPVRNEPRFQAVMRELKFPE